MGVKYGKEYDSIIDELSVAIMAIDGCYEYFDMTPEEWADMDPAEQRECMRTLSDDVFYGLGGDPEINLQTCRIAYDAANHIIKLTYEDNLVRVVRLI